MGRIIWLTGSSGVGKTTLAKALAKKLLNWIILDEDEVRKVISLEADFSKEEYNLRVAQLAKVLSEQGKNVVVSVTVSFQSVKDKINKIINCDWVYLKRANWDGQRLYESPANALILDVDNMTVEEEVDKVIEELRLFSVYVFGLPRSGTSLMTKICELLGVNMIYTSEENKERDENFRKIFGEYHPNPTGFYEITQNFSECYLKIVSNPYSGCKMIIPVAGHRWDWVKTYPSKVVMMTRDPEEIRQSQMAYFRRSDITVEAIRTLLVQEKVKLRNSGIKFIIVDYRDIIKNPFKTIMKVKNFIGSPRDIQKALEFVNPNLYRFKKEKLVPGL